MNAMNMQYSIQIGFVLTMLTSGCANFSSFNYPHVPSGSLAPKSQESQVKAVAVRMKVEILFNKEDSASEKNLCASFKIILKDKTVKKGVISSDLSIHSDPFFIPRQGVPGDVYMSPDGPYPESERQRLQGQQAEMFSAGIVMAAERVYDAFVARKRYRNLKETATGGFESFDIYVDYRPQWFPSDFGARLKLNASHILGTKQLPVTIITQDELKRIRKLIDSLEADFPGASVHKPTIFTNTENYLATLSPSDLILNLEIRQTPIWNSGLVIANGVVSAFTLFVIPWAFPEKYDLAYSLQTPSGDVIIGAEGSAKIIGLIGVPALLFAFSDEHAFFPARKQFTNEAMRKVAEELQRAAIP